MGKKKRILIVEDTPDLRKLEIRAFEEAGFEVDFAEDGIIAIKKIKETAFDLILMDIVMPNKTGFETLNELKGLKITIPVIIYSNMSELMSREEAIKAGAVDYFEKIDTPLTTMVEKVNEYLNNTCTLRTKI